MVEAAGLTSFSFGEDDECRFVVIFKKEFAPSNEELDLCQHGGEWDPRRLRGNMLKELAWRQEAEEARGRDLVGEPQWPL